MRIFYDTEFLEDGRTIELISIGLVADDGRELYLIDRDAPWARIRDHDWLMAHVIPQLPGASAAPAATASPTAHGDLIDLGHPCVQPRHVIADAVRDFIAAAADPQLWAWFGAYDHVALCQLFGPMIDLPACIPRWTNDLQQRLAEHPDVVPPPNPRAEHHALGDAHHARAIAIHLDSLEPGVTRPGNA